MSISPSAFAPIYEMVGDEVTLTTEQTCALADALALLLGQPPDILSGMRAKVVTVKRMPRGFDFFYSDEKVA
jgi:hypothetical protein